MVGPDDLQGVFQSKWFYYFQRVLTSNNGWRKTVWPISGLPWRKHQWAFRDFTIPQPLENKGSWCIRSPILNEASNTPATDRHNRLMRYTYPAPATIVWESKNSDLSYLCLFEQSKDPELPTHASVLFGVFYQILALMVDHLKKKHTYVFEFLLKFASHWFWPISFL